MKAKTIRERMANSSSDSMYSGMGSGSAGSRYGGSRNDFGGAGNKYAGYGSNTKGGSSTTASQAPYSSGSYDEGKSTLDKYRKGGKKDTK